jgi:hypothetical protein
MTTGPDDAAEKAVQEPTGPAQERVHGSSAGAVPGDAPETAGETGPTVHGGCEAGVDRLREVARDRPAGHVYLMGPLEGCYKIGKTNNPDRRELQLNTMLPVRVEIVHLIQSADMAWLEGYLHIVFHHQRARGEWFRLDDDGLALITELRVAHDESAIPVELVVLHRRNWDILHPSPARVRQGGTRKLSVSLPPDLAAELDAYADDRDQSYSDVVCRALRRHLDNPPPRPPWLKPKT